MSRLGRGWQHQNAGGGSMAGQTDRRVLHAAPRHGTPASAERAPASPVRPLPVAGLTHGRSDGDVGDVAVTRPASVLSLLKPFDDRPRAAAPVRRSVVDKKSTPLTWSQLSAMSGVKGAALAVQLVLRFWAETAHPATPVVLTSQKAIVATARAAVGDMPADFATWLDDAGLDEFTGSAARLSITLSPTLTAALDARRQTQLQAWTARLGPTPSLPTAQHDPRYSTPADYSTRPAAASGRDDGGWHSVSSGLTGVTGGSTGSVNHALAQEAITTGALRQHDDARATQICATCGRLTDATQFEVDHQQAFAELRDNLQMLAQAMALSATLHGDIKAATPSFDRFFQTTGVPGSGSCTVVLTAEAVHVYSNDIGNLMRICRQCNGAWGKSDMDMFAWFQSSPYFGQAFINANLPKIAHGEIIARTATGQGWGQAARDWFATHHLPVLKQQFVLEAASRFFHKQVTKQSRSALEATAETDPVKKSALEQQAADLTGHNTAFLNGVDADRRYFSGDLMGEPTPFAPGSPSIWDYEHEELAHKREKRKKHQATSSTTPYQDGYDRGMAHLPASDKAYSDDRDALDAYRQGYAQGDAAYQAAFQEGVRQALRVATVDQLPAIAGTLTDAGVAAGFRETAVNRHHAVDLGRAAARSKSVPDASAIPSGTPSSEVLLRDYLAGYAAGMTG